jgi:hypothetical protein
MNESIGDESRARPGLSLDAARLIEGGSHDEVAARHARPLRTDQSLAQRWPSRAGTTLGQRLSCRRRF